MHKLGRGQHKKVWLYVAVTGASDKVAVQALKASDWDLERAFDVFYSQVETYTDSMHLELEELHNIDEDPYVDMIPLDGIADDKKLKGCKYLKCNFCSEVLKEGLMKYHLACENVPICPRVPNEVKEEMIAYIEEIQNGGCNDTPLLEEGMNSCSSGSTRGVRAPIDRLMVHKEDEDDYMAYVQTKSPANTEEHQNQVCLAIGRFFFENGIPFNCATSSSYFNMIRTVGNYGSRLKLPTMHEMKTWILKEEVKNTSLVVSEIKETWKETGVSLLLDGWSDMRNKSMINFLVNNPHGTVFLKTVDASDCVKDAQKLFELVDEVVEEIGEDIVVQVITDNTSAYKAAGNLLMQKRESLYWTPSVAHCIDLMLEKIGELPKHTNVLLKAKKVSNFIHNHERVLSLARKYAKKDLLRPAITRCATTYLTLENMYELKQPLQMMFVSKEWSSCAWSKKEEGKAVKKIIMSDKTFWPSVVYCIKTTKPLVEVLTLVEGERMPTMSVIYGAMDEAKKNIAKNFDGDVASYKEILDIIDQNWETQLHCDLHEAAYFLNPQFTWSPDVSAHPEIKYGLYKSMDRMIKDPETYTKINDQTFTYRFKEGMFGLRACTSSYMTCPPVQWWDRFGDEVPELKKFAIRILGLTCSLSARERNWSIFNQAQTKKRNCLSTKKMNSLVYIMYNNKLKHRYMMKKSRKEDDDPLIVEDMPSDDEWLVNPNEDNRGPIEIEDEGGSSRKRRRRKILKTGKRKEILVDEEDEFEGGDSESDD